MRKKNRKKRKKIETTALKYNGLPITMGGHNKTRIAGRYRLTLPGHTPYMVGRLWTEGDAGLLLSQEPYPALGTIGLAIDLVNF